MTTADGAGIRGNRHWRMAVWSLRAGYLALAVVVAGLIVSWSGSTPWVLATGVVGWLAAAVVAAAGMVWSRCETPEPRPGFWSIRIMLVHDTIHPRAVRS